MRAVRNGEPRQAWPQGVLASVLVAGLFGALLGACAQSGISSPSEDTILGAPLGECAASSLVVTGLIGERLHPQLLPPGFVLEQGSETELGQGWLTYITAGSGDRPWLEMGKYNTTLSIADLLAGEQTQSVTIQSRPGVSTIAPSNETVNVAWEESPRIVLFVTGHKLALAEVVAIAQSVEYLPGSTFSYPIRPTVTLSRERAGAILPGGGPASKAVLTSFGEVDAVLSGPSLPLNHVPVLNPSIEVGRPVWVIWSGAGKGVVVDAVSSKVLASLVGVNGAALTSLHDRSRPGCAPPFGVLTRSEIGFVTRPRAGATTTMKLVTLQTLRSTAETSNLGNCTLHACDPNVPVWVIIRSAPDCSLLLRCTALPGQPPLPTAPPGSWSVTPFDARTGPQTGFATAAGGRGPLPLDVADLPDLEPE
jgi:hypothetical protein